MNFTSLRATVNKGISGYQFTVSNDPDVNEKNRIITGCLVYSALLKLMELDSSLQTKLSNKTIELAKVYKGIVENLSKKYISYKEIFRYLQDQDVHNFIYITRDQINHVVNLYENKQEIKKFTVKGYSQYMYNIMFITDTDNLYLKRIHYNVICPIVEYYMTYNAIGEKDVSVENVYSESPGKVIKLAIRGITCGKLYHDIDTNIMGNRKYIYKLELTDDGFLMITMN